MSSFTCPYCGSESFNWNDRRERYCGRCKRFANDALPGFWMHEKSGELEPAIWALLECAPITDRQIVLIRAYFRQWIMAPNWQGPAVKGLRARIDGLTSRKAIDDWLTDALKAGIDPL
jgi:hypothetical protein